MLHECPVCGGGPRCRGVLCAPCARELGVQEGLLPEHVVGSGSGRQEGALVDRWGRPHRLTRRTLIGRSVEGLCILSASVSRLHAEVRRDEEGWCAIDHASRNGTFVDGVRVVGAGPLRPGQTLAFGRIALWFVTGPLGTPAEAVRGSELRTDLSPACSPGRPTPLAGGMRLHGPSGSGGGVLERDGWTISLSARQYALVCAFAERWREEAGQLPSLRGFVTAAELLAGLSWDTPNPEDAHLKQLVRRLRKRLSQTGLLVEARHGLGYRLAAD